jgi:WD domain, G-beta repeat
MPTPSRQMHIAVTALTPELADALFGLAMFPPDTQIPTEAVARYWAHRRNTAQTTLDLTTLAGANVLRFEQGTVEFHDLQHDYLLLHAPALALLHSELLNAYRTLLPPSGHDQWWRLPIDEPYIWDRLIFHLRGAGERDTLATTVTNPAYLAHRVAGSGIHAAEADLARAVQALPGNAAISWWRRWLARHADLLTGTSGQDKADPRDTALVAPTMLAWLTADRGRPEWADPKQLSPLLPTPYLTTRWGLSPPPETLFRVLTGHTGWVTAVAWSPDGTRLATASHDQQIRIWDPTTGHTHHTLTGHTDRVTAVAWSPDSTQIASAASDGTVLVHDLRRGKTAHLRLFPLGFLAWSTAGIAVGGTNGVAVLALIDDQP